MTKKEFYTIIANGNFDAELVAHANEQLEKMTIANERAKERRQSRPTKAQIANAPLREAIVELLGAENLTASVAAQKLGISVQKASAILRGIETDGICTAEVTKNGKVYSITK